MQGQILKISEFIGVSPESSSDFTFFAIPTKRLPIMIYLLISNNKTLTFNRPSLACNGISQLSTV